jgi:hypothetical protein
MDQRKKINKSKYIAAFALTLVVFLVGYIVGNFISGTKLNSLSTLEQDIRIDSLSNELVFQLMEKGPCQGINMTLYTEDLLNIGKRLTYMESIYGYDSDKVVGLKKYYSLLLTRHWMLSEDMNAKCSYNRPLLLYFYTNYGCNDCNDQGLVLTNLYNNYPYFSIYSFEYNLDTSAVLYLKSAYNISQSQLPAIVFNGTVYPGFTSKDKLIEIMNLESYKSAASKN